MTTRRMCNFPGCDNWAALYMRKCLDHGFAATAPVADAVLVPVGPRSYDWDIVCLLCGQRRVARGTVDQARVTMAHLPLCGRCRGALIVENAEVGSISSPSAVHSAIYRHGYRVSTRPEAA